MRHCQSCGGVIGQDCFNPVECAWISQQQQMEKERQREAHGLDLEMRLQHLEARIEQLEKRLSNP